MPIQRFPLGPLDTNCYLLHDDATAIVIDPGGEPTPILTCVGQYGLTVTHIINTHAHFDHMYGNAALQAATGASILISQKDTPLLDMDLGRGGMFGLPMVASFTSLYLPEGKQTFGTIEVDIRPTPGHSPGSVSLYVPAEQAVFVGDLLFYRSVGRTDFQGGDAEELKQSVMREIFTLPEDTTVYPGHGPSTTVGDEKRNNPYFGDFVAT